MKTVGFLGAGNMGGALARAAAAGGKCRILVADKDAVKAKAISVRTGGSSVDSVTLAKESDIIFIGVKPNVIKCVVEEIRDKVKNEALIVCMAAAVDIATVSEYFGRDLPIIRIMPNTPVAVSEGLILYTPNKQAEGYCDELLSVMEKAGTFDRIDERFMDAAACISGCGPAFAYMFIEALADGGVACGLPRDKAMLYAARMLKGSAEMALNSGKHPGELKDAVCSPGGTTIDGVHRLEKAAFRATVSDAVIAAYDKTLAMKSK